MDLHTSSEASVKLGADLAVLGVVGAILGDAGGVRRRDGDRLARGIASRWARTEAFVAHSAARCEDTEL